MDSKELVEQWREHGPATGATLLEIAVSAGMPDDKRVKWCRALQYASTVADRAFDHLAAQDARIEALEGALETVFLHGHSSGWTGNQCRRDVKRDDAKKSWSFYVSDGGLSKTLAKAALGGEHGG